MVEKTLIFAVSARDALEQCQEMGLAFEEVVWVMNPALLGTMDTDGYSVVASPLFRQMPAFVDAKARFPQLPDQATDRKPVTPGPPDIPQAPDNPGRGK